MRTDPSRPSGPLRVLHVAQPVDGGVAFYVRAIARDQLSRGWDVAVACPERGDLAGWIGATDATHYVWNSVRSPTRGVIGEVRALRRVVRAFQPHVVHLHSSKAGMVGRLALRSTPVIFQPHGWSWEAVTGLIEKAATLWEKLAARRASAIVCVSEGERRRAEEKGVRGGFRVIANGVDLEAWPPASDGDRRRARQELGLGAGPLAVCAGTVRAAKGQDVLVDAWPAVRAGVPDARCVFVGEGEDRAALAGLAVAGIEFVGQRDDVWSWLAASNVVVIPSRWEGMSLVMLEAMATARSVVSTDVPGARDALDPDAIVPIEDPSALGAAVAERLSDPRRADAEGEAARERAARDFDFTRTCAELAELYVEVV